MLLLHIYKLNYLATCKKCKVQYVGSTSNELKVRFRNRKSAVLRNKTTCELAVHINRVEHQLSDFEFIVIEKVVNESEDCIDRRLLTRGSFLVLPVVYSPSPWP